MNGYWTPIEEKDKRTAIKNKMTDDNYKTKIMKRRLILLSPL